MARKDLLKGLMNNETPSAPATETRVDTARPRYSTGAIGAVSQSIADLKSRAVQEVDPRMIDPGGIEDRLDEDAGLDSLIASIREYGQQVPVLLRPNPNDPERYQVVYGRRRVAALKALGGPVKALIRDLDDRALIVTQGQENAARRDLSFIEKVNFARQMQVMGYERKVICDALHVDKTLISRMISVSDRVPPELIAAIGAAPSVGRDRWLALADLLQGRDAVALAVGDNSDARFDAVMAGLRPERKAPTPPAEIPLKGAAGQALGTAKRGRNKLTLSLRDTDTAAFNTWLLDNLPDLHQRWQSEQEE
ncbi:plasmid partitioning protein RepB [Palleronia caenipelagi]|uniref:Plasmid partitioning protein RepB n=1 Tax=Palleronia caenipelagi TaxID=2489174 RepID=A0A547PMN5_9RHOB|nr:plasmid partitioning protein RepB [Palleronia caenipelagi]TRD15375.1 plasmid partitioning protein RepB [Palleronia caenipelagi]